MNTEQSNVQLLDKDLGLICRIRLIQKIRAAFNESLDGMIAIYEDDWDNAHSRLDLILQNIENDNRKNLGMLLGLMGRLMAEETSHEREPYQ